MWTSPAHSGYLVRDTIFEDNGVGLQLGSSGEHPTLICRNRFQANNEFEAGGFGIFSDEGPRTSPSPGTGSSSTTGPGSSSPTVAPPSRTC